MAQKYSACEKTKRNRFLASHSISGRSSLFGSSEICPNIAPFRYSLLNTTKTHRIPDYPTQIARGPVSSSFLNFSRRLCGLLVVLLSRALERTISLASSSESRIISRPLTDGTCRVVVRCWREQSNRNVDVGERRSRSQSFTNKPHTSTIQTPRIRRIPRIRHFVDDDLHQQSRWRTHTRSRVCPTAASEENST